MGSGSSSTGSRPDLASPSRPGQTTSYDEDDHQVDPNAPRCSCNYPARRHRHMNGQYFYRCELWPSSDESCSFFCWAATEGAPLCQCQLPAVERTVKKVGPNCGRKLFACPKASSQQCKFFAWADASGPACLCGVPSVSFQVNKESANKGRWFRTCNLKRCKFWEWVDDNGKQCESKAAASDRVLPRAQPNAAMTAAGMGAMVAMAAGPVAGGPSKAQSGTCYNCKKEGHWASQCPLSKKRQSVGAASPGNTCYHCGKAGHWAKDCQAQKKRRT